MPPSLGGGIVTEADPENFSTEETERLLTLLERLEHDTIERTKSLEAPPPRPLSFVRDLALNGEEEYSLTELANWITTYDAPLSTTEYAFLKQLADTHFVMKAVGPLKKFVSED